MNRSRSCLLAIAVSLLPGAGVSVAQVPGFDLKKTFINPNPAIESQFGYAVAIVGGNVLVSAPFDDGAATDAGVAYLFDRQTGDLLKTLRGPRPAAGDRFGVAVAAVPLPSREGVEGVGALVGAPGDDTGATNAGAAYLFDGRTGDLIRTFQKATPAPDDGFGSAVGAVGNRVLVGAPGDDLGGADAGGAYLFDVGTGVVLHTFRNPTPDPGDGFGTCLAAAGSRVLIGAVGDDAAGRDAGAVHLFDGGTGSLVGSVPNPRGQAGDEFGAAVAPIGNDFLAGAPFEDSGAVDAGWVYRISGATGERGLGYANPVPFSRAHFGRSVAILGDQVLIGAPGSTQVHRGGGVWLSQVDAAGLPLLRNPTPADGDQFGFAIAAAGDHLVVGAPADDTGATDSGAVYLFRGQ